jgi:nickel-type superoxide dismutase maturation protease
MRLVVFGSSMEPEFKAGDHLWASKLFYRLFKPKVGEVVVLRDPRDGRLILKRIWEVKAGGYYFVGGDNEKASTDSRTFGPVKKEDIIAKVLFKY